MDARTHNRSLIVWLTGLLLLAAVVGLQVWSGRSAAVPAVFGRHLTLAQATQQAAASGRMVFVFSSLTGCAPCQSLKRGAMTNPEVIAWIEANTEPVYLEAPADRDQVATLGVQAFPTLTLLRGDKIIDRLEGDRPAADLLAWFKRAASPGPG
jgi:thioredoxin-related protein